MIKDRPISFGELTTIIYDFEFKGDSLPEHWHEIGLAHITICAKGEIEVVTPEWTKTLREGNIIEFYPKQSHSITALIDDTRIVSITTTYVKPS